MRGFRRRNCRLSGERDSKGGKGEKDGQNGKGFHGTAGGVTDFNEIGELEEGKELPPQKKPPSLVCRGVIGWIL